MAKRELIDREQVITEIKYMDNNGFITRSVNHVCEDIRMIPVITEQEIVKPYLEKFNTLIREHHMNDLADDEMSNFERDILNLIDNLLSEQEGKE